MIMLAVSASSLPASPLKNSSKVNEALPNKSPEAIENKRRNRSKAVPFLLAKNKVILDLVCSFNLMSFYDSIDIR